MNKKLDKVLTIINIIILTISFITFSFTTVINLIKSSTKENNLENNNKEFENLIIEELIEIYNSEVYTYTIEELPNAQEGIKYCCLIKFYDVKNYTERIMFVTESDDIYTEANVYTEVIIEDKDFE